ncbi:MAG TPA: hypothetical protein VMG38_22755 [Trebonia sp.]|nr:hypothetical protein [Trebonia sp.]
MLHKFSGDQAQAARLEEHMAALARAQGQPYAILAAGTDAACDPETGTAQSRRRQSRHPARRRRPAPRSCPEAIHEFYGRPMKNE